MLEYGTRKSIRLQYSFFIFRFSSLRLKTRTNTQTIYSSRAPSIQIVPEFLRRDPVGPSSGPMPDWFGGSYGSGSFPDPWAEDDEGPDPEEQPIRNRDGPVPRTRRPSRGSVSTASSELGGWGIFGIISLILIILFFLGCSASYFLGK